MKVDVRLNAIVDPERANGRSLADLTREQIGPRTLRERVASLGGSLDLETSAKGSRVRLTVPLVREVA